MKKYPFEKCKIRTHQRDLSKEWYVQYKIYDHASGELVWRKKRGGINRYHTIEGRLAAAQNLKKAIDEMLEAGATLNDTTSRKKSLGEYSIKEAFEFSFAVKEKTTRESNLRYYKRILNLFPDWLKSKGKEGLQLRHLSKDIMFAFFDELPELIKPKLSHGERPNRISNKTINNYLTYINALLRELDKRDRRIFPNGLPTQGIKFLAYETSKHNAYSKEQLRKVRAVCDQLEYHQLWLFVQFIYYSLARPNELLNLKIEHINLATDQLYLPAGRAKGRQGMNVDIYPPLREAILEAGLDNQPANFYVFGNQYEPGPKAWSRSALLRQHKRVLEEANLNRGERKHDMYGYKHSGVISLYLDGLDLIDIQRQCRHQTPEQTMKYLRELDLFRTKDHFNKVSRI